MGERPARAGRSPSSIGTVHGSGPGAAPEPAPQAPDGRLDQLQSGVIPASFISLDHFAWSLRMKRANSSGVLPASSAPRSEEHTSELQSRLHLVCRLLLEKKKKNRHHFVSC